MLPVRDRILQAALAILAESGAHELTQPRVARAAGVRQSHLTYYFPTRGALLQEVARYSMEKLVAQLAHGNPAAVPEAIAAGAADKRRSRIMLGLVAAADRDPKIRQSLRRFIAELRSRMAPLLGAAGLASDAQSIAFFHAVIVGCAVLQIARDTPAARAEAKAVLRKAARCIAR